MAGICIFSSKSEYRLTVPEHPHKVTENPVFCRVFCVVVPASNKVTSLAEVLYPFRANSHSRHTGRSPIRQNGNHFPGDAPQTSVRSNPLEHT
jgi:hypothetical protein